MTSSLVRFPALLIATVLALPSGAAAQYFGRNKVQYESLDFQVLPTPHYEIHFYPEAAIPVEDGARMAERWYERIARIFQHDIREPRPLVLYADHPDFQQTNILSGSVGEGTGGVTEGLQDRIILPLGSSYGDTHHVLGHEIVHSFQFDLASGSQGAGLRGLMQLPLWFIEGMAEYISVGHESSLTAMWIRDALLHGAFPTLDDLSSDPRRYFPYRFGHAFWAHVAGEYGDPAVTLMMRTAARSQWRPAVASVLRVDPDTLAAAWREAVEARYSPLMVGRTPPEEAGTLLLSPATGAGTQNLAPSLSPDGRYVAYLSEQDLFTIELYLADARTGEVLRSITSSTRDAHYDAMRFLDSSGAWAPDGSAVAVVVYSEGRNEIQLYDPQDGSRDRVLQVPATIGEIRNPAFSPDGSRIVFSGQSGGVTDLFMIDAEGGEPVRLTDDRYAQLQPTFSPDGSRLAFVTDLGPSTDFDRLIFGPMVIALMDLETREIERIAPLGETEHWNPQFTPDGAGLYFLADQDGFRDIYRLGMDTGQVWQVTRVVTGVSGITEATPALSVASETGTVAFTVFDDAEYHVYALTAVESEGSLVGMSRTVVESGAQLGPSPDGADDLVSPLLSNADAGLVADGTYSAEDAEPVDGGLRLVALGQPAVGVGNDIFGTYVGGSVSALFSDILGDRNLYTSAQAQGELKDVGGQVFYQDIGSRWNWGLGVAHVPIRYGFYQYVEPTVSGASYAVEQTDYRIFVSSAEGQLAYPFSANRRVELSAGVKRYGFDIEADVYSYNIFNQPIALDRSTRPAGDPLNLAEASVALVEDNSFTGFTSPIRGFRTRLEVGQTTGTEDFMTVLADVRRYYSPHQELTFAIRAMHFGRYGTSPSTSLILGDLFVGSEYFIRGYSYGSFSVQECTRTDSATCGEVDRLLGQRLGVMNLEVRVPLLGTERLGLFEFPYLPTELVGFFDGGLAWNEGFPGFEGGPPVVWDRNTADRVPVFSAGVSARMSLFGALVLEVYYAKPFQRPGKGMHWGVNFVPGW